MNLTQKRAWRLCKKALSGLLRDVARAWRTFWKDVFRKKSSHAVFPEVLTALVVSAWGVLRIMGHLAVFVYRYYRAS